MNNVKFVWMLVLGLLLISGAGWYGQRITNSQPRKPPPRPIIAQPNAAPRPRQTEAQAAPLWAAIAAHPRDLRPRWALVALYGQTGQASKASAEADAIDRRHPSDLPNLLALGNTRMLLHQYDQAEREYQQALANQPNIPAALQGLATAQYKQGRYLEAMQSAQKAVVQSPKDPGAHLTLALAALQYGSQFPSAGVHAEALETARLELQQLTQTLPNQAEVYYQLGQTDALQGDYDAAKKNLTYALKLSPRRDIYQAEARVAFNSGDEVSAQKKTEEALSRFPDDAVLHDLRGRLIQASSTPDANTDALADFQKATELQPNVAAFQSRLGAAYLRAHRLPEARSAFEVALQLDPNQAFPYQQLATIYVRLGDPVRAKAAADAGTAQAFNAQQLKQIQSLAQVHPDSVPLHLILADRYRQLHMAGASRDEYLLVRSLDPTNKRANQGLAALKAPGPQ